MNALGRLGQLWTLARNFGHVRHALSTLASLHSGDGVQDALGGLTDEETGALARWAAEAGRDVVEIGALFGMTTRELLRAVRRLTVAKGLAGMDVVEVSPPYDHAGITALAAHSIVLEALSGLAVHRRGGEARPEVPA